MILVLSPHNDDETLFAAFTVIREHAHVIVCHTPPPGWGDKAQRAAETRNAVKILTGTFEQWDVPTDSPAVLTDMLEKAKEAYRPGWVYAPDMNASHTDHRLLGKCAAQVFAGALTTYHTYVGRNRIVSGRTVAIKDPIWTQMKLAALTQYPSQATDPRVAYHFLAAQDEYYGRDL